MSHGQNRSRRQFIKMSLLGVSSAVTLSSLLVGKVNAADLPHIEETDPIGSALGYKHDTSTVDAAKYPLHKADQSCANCNLYQGAADAWGPCAIFPGKAVNAKGWCAAWVRKP